MTPRVLRVAGPAILGGVTLIALVGALWFGGGAAQIPLGDAGPVVRWGLPVTKLVVNLAAAGMVGVLVTALFTLRAGEREFDVALDTASISAALFTVAAGATGFLTLLSVFNPAIDAGPQFGAQLGRFLVELEVGRTWLITTVAGAALTVLTFAVRSWVGTLLVALVAVAVPLVLVSIRINDDRTTESTVSSVADAWADRNGWTVASVSSQPDGTLIRALGPLPEPNTASLRQALARAGLGRERVKLELVPSHTVEVGRGG